MPIRVAFLAWTQNNTDTDYSKAFFENIRSAWVITWLDVSDWSIQPWSALIQATRTSGETLLVPVIIDQAISVDTTGTKKIYLEIDQSLLDDGSSMESDHTGVVSVQTAGSYPADNFLKIADVTSGVVTDEREFSRVKITPWKAEWNWKFFVSNGSGELVEVGFGSSWQALFSNWASALPWFDDVTVSVPSATEGTEGISYEATQSEIDLWTDVSKFVTPDKLKATYWKTYSAWTDVTVAEANTERSTTSSSYSEKKKITIDTWLWWTYRFSLSFKPSFSGGHARILLNGVQEQERYNSNNSYNAVSRDITVSDGDEVTVEIKSSGSTCYVKDFQMRYSVSENYPTPSATVTTD